MSVFVLNVNDTNRANVLANCTAFIESLSQLKPWQVTIEPHKKEISSKQRKSIFGPAYKALMEFSGLEGDEDKRSLHRFMCGEFFGWRDLPLGRKPRRTTTKDEWGKHDPIKTDEAARFYEFLQRRGADVGCYVPDPDPLWRESK
jgi:hypothetical protein